jgi:hypothetical protein
MVTTRVTWVYPTDANEQTYTLAGLTTGDVTSDLLAELNTKAIELAGNDTATASLEIEEDSENQIHRHTRTRSWPDLATAQEWVTFVLSKGAETAVVVEE